MKIFAYGMTHTGLMRDENQDTFYCSEDERMFAIFDGMGGHSGGALASNMLVHRLRDNKSPFKSTGKIDQRTTAEAFIAAADEAIADHGHQHPELRGLGSTAVLLNFIQEKDGLVAQVCNVGDSRVYVLRDGSLFQIGIDQTWVNERVRFGALPREEEREKNRHAISRCVGCGEKKLADFFFFPTKPGDVFLISSDGLHGYVPHQTICDILAQGNGWSDPHNLLAQLCERLIDSANEAGGYDNTTVVLVAVETPSPMPPQSTPLWLVGSTAGAVSEPQSWQQLWTNHLCTPAHKSAGLFLSSNKGDCLYLQDREHLRAALENTGIVWTQELEEVSKQALSEAVEHTAPCTLPLQPAPSAPHNSRRVWVAALLVLCAGLISMGVFWQSTPLAKLWERISTP